MTECDSLLAAIVADPESALPRLVYADYLDEIGDTDCAELIRLQNGYFKHWTNAEEMEAREAELIEAAQAMLPVVPGITFGRMVRGFPERISLSPACTDLDRLDEVLSRYPITWFDLSQGYPDAFTEGEWLARARVIDLSHQRFMVDEDYRHFFARVDPERLRVLIWRDAGIRDEEVVRLTRMPQLAKLSELCLANNDIGPAGGWALIQCEPFTWLRYLDLSGNHLDNAAPSLEHHFGKALRLA